MPDRLSDDRWRALSGHLDRALDLSTEQRAEWLAALRADDGELAADLEVLLERHSALSEAGFLDGTVPAPPLEGTLAGQRIGSYRLRCRIGQGGMGSVWLADRDDGRFEGVAAVKLLNASLVGREGEARFRREGSILARLRHPHIAHLVDAGISPLGHPYLVLEHVDGERIDRYCDARRLRIETRIRLFLDVLAAVAHAHANLVVHRDIKPSNVLVTSEGQVKLLDFGIAKLLEAEGGGGEQLTREGEAALTPEYAAPEQLTGGAVTTGTDVYALGVLLYLVLSGRHPAGASTTSPAELVRAVVETEPLRVSDAVTRTGTSAPEAMETAARRATSPRKLRALLKGDLDNIVAKALKKRAPERYASVEALAEDLRRHLVHEPVSARSDSVVYRASRFVRRHVQGVTAAALVALLLAGLVSFYTIRLATERDRVRREAEKAARVSELLTGLLTGADPYQAREKREPTVREILDAGAERIQKELAGEPELLAEMLTVMGSVYQRLGAHDKAKVLLEQAVAGGRRALGPDHERVAQSLHELGVVMREKGDLAAAAAVLEEALAMRRRLLGAEHRHVADTLQELAYLHDLRRDGLFEARIREALAIRRKVLGEEHRDTVSSLNDLGLFLLLHKDDVAGAEPLLRQCLATNRKLLGEDHPDVGTAMGNLALAVQAKGDFVEAESLIRQALAVSRKALGDRHLDVGIKLYNLAKALRSQGKHDEAAAALEEALDITRPALGNDHSRTVQFMVYLAATRLDQGQASVAEPMLRHALKVRQRTLPADDSRLGQTKSILGGVLTKLARYDEAEPLLVDARRILKDANAPGWEGQEARTTLTRLVALYEAWGRPQHAARYRDVATPR